MRFTKDHLLLYAVTDRSRLETCLEEQVERVLQAGGTMVQLREKGLDTHKTVSLALALKPICARYGAPLIVNDDVEAAYLSDADGVHVGQSDMQIERARERLGPDKIIGGSAHTVDEALGAQAAGADYLGCGAVFGSRTKTNVTPLSHDVLRDICRAVTIPVVAIGGITAQNILKLKGTGVDGVAVVSALFDREDPFAYAEALLALSREMTYYGGTHE